MGLRSWIVLLLCQAAALAAPQVSISVIDQGGQPVLGARIQLRTPSGKIAAANTDAKGHAEFPQLESARYEITVTRDGFEPVKQEIDLAPGQSVAIDLTLVPALGRR